MEREEIARAPAIPSPLKIHKAIRKHNSRNICYLKIFDLSDQSILTIKQFYRKDPDICDHIDLDLSDQSILTIKQFYRKDPAICDHIDLDVNHNACAY